MILHRAHLHRGILSLLLLGCAPVPPAQSPDLTEPAACIRCHPAEVAQWEGTHHNLAERMVGPLDGWATDLHGQRVIGVDPLQQALVRAENGAFQAHSQAWDPSEQESFSLHTDDRQPGDWGHWQGGGMNWNARCATCHNTAVRKNLQPDGSYATTVGAVGVRCAACHGDASSHVRGGLPPKNPRMEDTCAACHSHRAELTDGFTPGEPYLDHFLPTLTSEPQFRPDGLALEEVFEFNNFVASGMHGAGVRCGDCHDPHSGLLKRSGDALCTACHTQPTGHPSHPGAEVLCVDCHMPTLRLMQRHNRRDHGFTSPSRGLTPDPCARCHPEHPATAAPPRVVSAIRTGAADPTLFANRGQRAAVLAASGDPEVIRRGLTEPDPWVRLGATRAFHPQTQSDLERLRELGRDPVRAIRVAAQRTLAQAGEPLSRTPDYDAYLSHNADDPTVLAERGMVRVQQRHPGGLPDLRRAVTLDRRNPRLVEWLSIGLSSSGRTEEAVEVLRTGTTANPEDAGLALAYGLALGAVGRSEAAVESLERAVTLDPSLFRGWRSLSLLDGQLGRTGDARRAGARALALRDDPELRQWLAGL